MKKRTLAIIIISGIFVFFYHMKTNTEIEIGESVYRADKDYLEVSKEFKELIGRLGAKEAYETVGTYIKNEPINKQRQIMLVFGLALYEVEGKKSLSVCDEKYWYGCGHGFFYKFISEKGSEAVSVAESHCRKYYSDIDSGLSCHTAIGRGMQNFMGHNRLNQSLNKCLKLPWKGYLFGCQDGVLTEYLSPLENQTKNKTMSMNMENDLYDPCLKVETRFKRACFYILPVKWMESFNKDINKIGDLCSLSKDQEAKTACFVGIGKILSAERNYRIEPILADCNKMPGREGIFLCLSSAYLTIATTWPDREEEAKILCDGLKPAMKNLCINKESFENELVFSPKIDMPIYKD